MRRVPRIQKECPICGETFETTESLIKLGAGKYCSAPCRAIGAGRKTSETRMKNPKRITKVCETCGKEFSVYPSWAYRKHCSVECTKSERLKLTCEECGKEFTRTPGYLKACKGAGKYCSKKCARRGQSKLTGEKARHWQGGKIKRNCKQCGKEFEVFKSKLDVGEGNFCSKSCSARYNLPKGERNPNFKSILGNCKQCGKEIFIKPYQLKRKNGNFCSKGCSYLWISENLSGERSHSYKRKKFTCIICGKEFAIPKNLEEKGRTKYCSVECYWKDLPELMKQQWADPENYKSRLASYLRGADHPNYTGGPKIYCAKWCLDLWKRIDAAQNYQSILSGKTKKDNGGRALDRHHVYWQPKACCVWDEDAQGYYAMINIGTHKKPEMYKHYIKGDPNKFVLLTRKEHALVKGNKKDGTTKLTWIKILEDLIETKLHGRCYLTKEEYDALN